MMSVVPDRTGADMRRRPRVTSAGRVLLVACAAVVAVVLAVGLTPARPALALRSDRAVLAPGIGVRTPSSTPSTVGALPTVGALRPVDRQAAPPTTAPAGSSESDDVQPGGQALALVIVGAIVFVLVVGGILVWASGRRNRDPRP